MDYNDPFNNRELQYNPYNNPIFFTTQSFSHMIFVPGSDTRNAGAANSGAQCPQVLKAFLLAGGTIQREKNMYYQYNPRFLKRYYSWIHIRSGHIPLFKFKLFWIWTENQAVPWFPLIHQNCPKLQILFLGGIDGYSLFCRRIDQPEQLGVDDSHKHPASQLVVLVSPHSNI